MMMNPRIACLFNMTFRTEKRKKEITGLKMIPEWFVSPKSYNASLPESSVKKLCGGVK